jgi:hypothetical protein
MQFEVYRLRLFWRINRSRGVSYLRGFYMESLDYDLGEKWKEK